MPARRISNASLLLISTHQTRSHYILEQLTVLIIMASDATSTSRNKSRPAPMSPMRVLWLYATHDKWHSSEEENRKRSRNRSRDVDVDFIGSDANGFIYGQKLQPHKLTEIPMQDEHAFPKCMGRDILKKSCTRNMAISKAACSTEESLLSYAIYFEIGEPNSSIKKLDSTAQSRLQEKMRKKSRQ
jgi:hypothetical protein